MRARTANGSTKSWMCPARTTAPTRASLPICPRAHTWAHGLEAMPELNLQTRKARRHTASILSHTLDIGETNCKHATMSLAWLLTCGGDGVPRPRHLGRLRRSTARSPSASRRLCHALTSLQRSNVTPSLVLCERNSKNESPHSLVSALLPTRTHAPV